MPTFSYKALNASGRYINGTIDARSASHARQKLRAERLTPVDLYDSDSSDVGKGGSTRVIALIDRNDLNFKRSESDRQKLLFLSKLFQLVESGMPLGDAMRSLSQRINEPRMRSLCHYIYKDLAEGNTLADAMRSFPQVFDGSIASMIEAGEATGNLKPILSNIIALLETRIAMRKKIVGGFAYPVFIMFVAFGVVAFFLFFLLPRIEGIMSTLGGDMTWSARAIIWFAEASFFYGPFLIVGLIVAAITTNQWYKTEEGRMKIDRFMFKVPVLKKIVAHNEICRISNLFSTLLGSGVNATESLRLIERAIQNRYLQSRFRSARVLINDGASFSNALLRYSILEEMDVDILAIGENTGNLVSGFESIYKRHNTELAEEMQLLTVVIATGALLFAFSLVILLAVGIVSSILSVSQNILG